MNKITFDKTWSILLGEPLGDLDYWVEKGKIPLGTLKPFELYEDTIPEEDIVTIDFDKINVPVTSRRALNILLLGGSGDGKSLLLKLIWAVLHRAGWFTAYVDPKSTDSGRARMEWDSPRIPPHMKPGGIQIQHFMPVWALQDFQHLAHNFRHYSTRLDKISEIEMWMGLGMTSIGASKTAKIIKHYIIKKEPVTMRNVKQDIFDLPKEDLPEQSMNAVIRTITDLEDYDVVNENYQELNLLKEWKEGNSVCISYNSASRIRMTFDIGQKIKESARYYFIGNRIPIMWFLDDASLFAKEMPTIIRYNFAVEQIKDIGFNYRSLGVYNCMAVQSLGIIDENVAETYKIKIISPLFQGIDQLSSINIPKKAIQYLRDGVLVKDKKTYTMQYILITEDAEVVPFFPFTPPVNHFSPVYHEKEEEVKA